MKVGDNQLYSGLNDLYFGWGHLAKKGIKMIEMPFNPRASLNEPFVQFLAEKLSIEIAQASGIEPENHL